MTAKVKVWDLPLRLFHWTLVLAVTAAIITGKIGGEWADWHGSAGLAVLWLVVFRVMWGFVGTTHARFANFFPTPGRTIAYLKGTWQGIGHNPLGALSVLALLTLIAAQVGTGLLANDDIAFEGPLAQFVDRSFSNEMTGWHVRIFYGLATLIGLHIASILFYAWVKKHNLVWPMFTGWARLPGALADDVTITSNALGRCAVVVGLSGLAVWGVLNVQTTRVIPEKVLSLIAHHTAATDEEPEPAAN
jgi:cytochrome b